MAKKKKYRQVPSARARRYPSARPPARPMAPEDTASAQRPTRFTAAAKAAAPRDWAYEYRYVIADLKRMGYTTAAMFALLFVLAIAVQFFLR